MKKRLSGLKKKAASLIVLFIFLLPLALTVKWVYDIFGGDDSRKVYSQNELAEFQKSDVKQSSDKLRPFDEPLITITFDDGWESAYTTALPVLEKYHIKTTQYILGDQFDDPQYMSVEQVKALEDAGHEIGAHTMTHQDLTILPEDKMEWEQAQSYKLLSQKFGPIREFAVPFGAYNESVLTHTKKYYRSMRNTAGDPAMVDDLDINVKEGFNPYNINAYTVRDTTTMEDIQRLIDYTVKRKGWLVLTYHQVGDTKSPWAVSARTLDTQLKAVRKSNTRTAVMGDVLDAIEKRGEQ